MATQENNQVFTNPADVQADALSRAKATGTVGASYGADATPIGSRTSSSPAPTYSPAVVTSNLAQNDLNGIQNHYDDIKTGVTNQAVANANTTAVNNATAQAASDKAQEQKNTDTQNQTAQQVAQAKIAALTSDVNTATAGGYGANDQINRDAQGNIIPKTTPTDNTPQPAQQSSEETNYQNNVGQAINETSAAYADYKNQVQQLRNGTFPLSSAQQALVDSTGAAFDSAIKEANLRGAALSSETGGFSNKVTQALGEVSNIDATKAASLAKLEIGFQDQNYKQITDAYNAFTDAEKTKTDLLDKLHSDAVDQAKTLRKENQDAQDKVDQIALEAGKNGATPDIIAKIRASGLDFNSAISAAGNYLQSATGQLGDYLQYKKDTDSKGLVPSDYTTWKAQDDARQAKLDAQKAYSNAYASESAKSQFTDSDKNQQKLEQQYRGVLSKEFSSRTGALGVENAKVNQANHLNSLVTQYYDPKTGNYNVPKSQYGELVLGLANLVSPSGVASDSLREEINQATAKGDINNAIAYVTGAPQNGSTQDVINNFIDSIDRQAETAVSNRETALQNMRDQAPTDLEQSRVDALNKSTQMVGYSGQDRIDKSSVNNYVKTNPDAASFISGFYNTPGATDSAIWQYIQQHE